MHSSPDGPGLNPGLVLGTLHPTVSLWGKDLGVGGFLCQDLPLCAMEPMALDPLLDKAECLG